MYSVGQVTGRVNSTTGLARTFMLAKGMNFLQSMYEYVCARMRECMFYNYYYVPVEDGRDVNPVHIASSHSIY